MNSGPYRGALSKIGLILLIGLIQSVTIAAVGVARDSITPGVFTALRVSIASLALAGLLCLLRPQYRWQLRPAADMVIIAPLALIVEGSPAFAAYSLPAWAATIIAALGTPVLGFWLLYYVVERYSASLAGFTGVATPLFSAAIGIAFLDEVFTLPMAIGALLLVGGVLIFTRT